MTFSWDEKVKMRPLTILELFPLNKAMIATKKRINLKQLQCGLLVVAAAIYMGQAHAQADVPVVTKPTSDLDAFGMIVGAMGIIGVIVLRRLSKGRK